MSGQSVSEGHINFKRRRRKIPVSLTPKNTNYYKRLKSLLFGCFNFKKISKFCKERHHDADYQEDRDLFPLLRKITANFFDNEFPKYMKEDNETLSSVERNDSAICIKETSLITITSGILDGASSRCKDISQCVSTTLLDTSFFELQKPIQYQVFPLRVNYYTQTQQQTTNDTSSQSLTPATKDVTTITKTSTIDTCTQIDMPTVPSFLVQKIAEYVDLIAEKHKNVCNKATNTVKDKKSTTVLFANHSKMFESTDDTTSNGLKFDFQTEAGKQSNKKKSIRMAPYDVASRKNRCTSTSDTCIYAEIQAKFQEWLGFMQRNKRMQQLEKSESSTNLTVTRNGQTISSKFSISRDSKATETQSEELAHHSILRVRKVSEKQRSSEEVKSSDEEHEISPKEKCIAHQQHHSSDKEHQTVRKSLARERQSKERKEAICKVAEFLTSDHPLLTEEIQRSLNKLAAYRKERKNSDMQNRYPTFIVTQSNKDKTENKGDTNRKKVPKIIIEKKKKVKGTTNPNEELNQQLEDTLKTEIFQTNSTQHNLDFISNSDYKQQSEQSDQFIIPKDEINRSEVIIEQNSSVASENELKMVDDQIEEITLEMKLFLEALLGEISESSSDNEQENSDDEAEDQKSSNKELKSSNEQYQNSNKDRKISDVEQLSDGGNEISDADHKTSNLDKKLSVANHQISDISDKTSSADNKTEESITSNSCNLLNEVPQCSNAIISTDLMLQPLDENSMKTICKSTPPVTIVPLMAQYQMKEVRKKSPEVALKKELKNATFCSCQSKHKINDEDSDHGSSKKSSLSSKHSLAGSPSHGKLELNDDWIDKVLTETKQERDNFIKDPTKTTHFTYDFTVDQASMAGPSYYRRDELSDRATMAGNSIFTVHDKTTMTETEIISKAVQASKPTKNKKMTIKEDARNWTDASTQTNMTEVNRVLSGMLSSDDKILYTRNRKVIEQMEDQKRKKVKTYFHRAKSMVREFLYKNRHSASYTNTNVIEEEEEFDEEEQQNTEDDLSTSSREPLRVKLSNNIMENDASRSKTKVINLPEASPEMEISDSKKLRPADTSALSMFSSSYENEQTRFRTGRKCTKCQKDTFGMSYLGGGDTLQKFMGPAMSNYKFLELLPITTYPVMTSQDSFKETGSCSKDKDSGQNIKKRKKKLAYKTKRRSKHDITKRKKSNKRDTSSSSSSSSKEPDGKFTNEKMVNEWRERRYEVSTKFEKTFRKEDPIKCLCPKDKRKLEDGSLALDISSKREQKEKKPSHPAEHVEHEKVDKPKQKEELPSTSNAVPDGLHKSEKKTQQIELIPRTLDPKVKQMVEKNLLPTEYTKYDTHSSEAEKRKAKGKTYESLKARQLAKQVAEEQFIAGRFSQFDQNRSDIARKKSKEQVVSKYRAKQHEEEFHLATQFLQSDEYLAEPDEEDLRMEAEQLKLNQERVERRKAEMERNKIREAYLRNEAYLKNVPSHISQEILLELSPEVQKRIIELTKKHELEERRLQKLSETKKGEEEDELPECKRVYKLTRERNVLPKGVPKDLAAPLSEESSEEMLFEKAEQSDEIHPKKKQARINEEAVPTDISEIESFHEFGDESLRSDIKQKKKWWQCCSKKPYAVEKEAQVTSKKTDVIKSDFIPPQTEQTEEEEVLMTDEPSKEKLMSDVLFAEKEITEIKTIKVSADGVDLISDQTQMMLAEQKGVAETFDIQPKSQFGTMERIQEKSIAQTFHVPSAQQAQMEFVAGESFQSNIYNDGKRSKTTVERQMMLAKQKGVAKTFDTEPKSLVMEHHIATNAAQIETLESTQEKLIANILDVPSTQQAQMEFVAKESFQYIISDEQEEQELMRNYVALDEDDGQNEDFQTDAVPQITPSQVHKKEVKQKLYETFFTISTSASHFVLLKDGIIPRIHTEDEKIEQLVKFPQCCQESCEGSASNAQKNEEEIHITRAEARKELERAIKKLKEELLKSKDESKDDTRKLAEVSDTKEAKKGKKDKAKKGDLSPRSEKEWAELQEKQLKHKDKKKNRKSLEHHKNRRDLLEGGNVPNEQGIEIKKEEQAKIKVKVIPKQDQKGICCHCDPKEDDISAKKGADYGPEILPEQETGQFLQREENLPHKTKIDISCNTHEKEFKQNTITESPMISSGPIRLSEVFDRYHTQSSKNSIKEITTPEETIGVTDAQVDTEKQQWLRIQNENEKVTSGCYRDVQNAEGPIPQAETDFQLARINQETYVKVRESKQKTGNVEKDKFKMSEVKKTDYIMAKENEKNRKYKVSEVERTDYVHVMECKEKPSTKSAQCQMETEECNDIYDDRTKVEKSAQKKNSRKMELKPTTQSHNEESEEVSEVEKTDYVHVMECKQKPSTKSAQCQMETEECNDICDDRTKVEESAQKKNSRKMEPKLITQNHNEKPEEVSEVERTDYVHVMESKQKPSTKSAQCQMETEECNDIYDDRTKVEESFQKKHSRKMEPKPIIQNHNEEPEENIREEKSDILKPIKCVSIDDVKKREFVSDSDKPPLPSEEYQLLKGKEERKPDEFPGIRNKIELPRRKWWQRKVKCECDAEENKFLFRKSKKREIYYKEVDRWLSEQGAENKPSCCEICPPFVPETEQPLPVKVPEPIPKPQKPVQEEPVPEPVREPIEEVSVPEPVREPIEDVPVPEPVREPIKEVSVPEPVGEPVIEEVSEVREPIEEVPEVREPIEEVPVPEPVQEPIEEVPVPEPVQETPSRKKPVKHHLVIKRLIKKEEIPSRKDIPRGEILIKNEMLVTQSTIEEPPIRVESKIPEKVEMKIPETVEMATPAHIDMATSTESLTAPEKISVRDETTSFDITIIEPPKKPEVIPAPVEIPEPEPKIIPKPEPIQKPEPIVEPKPAPSKEEPTKSWWQRILEEVKSKLPKWEPPEGEQPDYIPEEKVLKVDDLYDEEEAEDDEDVDVVVGGSKQLRQKRYTIKHEKPVTLRYIAPKDIAYLRHRRPLLEKGEHVGTHRLKNKMIPRMRALMPKVNEKVGKGDRRIFGKKSPLSLMGPFERTEVADVQQMLGHTPSLKLNVREMYDHIRVQLPKPLDKQQHHSSSLILIHEAQEQSVESTKLSIDQRFAAISENSSDDYIFKPERVVMHHRKVPAVQCKHLNLKSGLRQHYSENTLLKMLPTYTWKKFEEVDLNKIREAIMAHDQLEKEIREAVEGSKEEDFEMELEDDEDYETDKDARSLIDFGIEFSKSTQSVFSSKTSQEQEEFDDDPLGHIRIIVKGDLTDEIIRRGFIPDVDEEMLGAEISEEKRQALELLSSLRKQFNEEGEVDAEELENILTVLGSDKYDIMGLFDPVLEKESLIRVVDVASELLPLTKAEEKTNPFEIALSYVGRPVDTIDQDLMKYLHSLDVYYPRYPYTPDLTKPEVVDVDISTTDLEEMMLDQSEPQQQRTGEPFAVDLSQQDCVDLEKGKAKVSVKKASPEECGDNIQVVFYGRNQFMVMVPEKMFEPKKNVINISCECRWEKEGNQDQNTLQGLPRSTQTILEGSKTGQSSKLRRLSLKKILSTGYTSDTQTEERACKPTGNGEVEIKVDAAKESEEIKKALELEDDKKPNQESEQVNQQEEELEKELVVGAEEKTNGKEIPNKRSERRHAQRFIRRYGKEKDQNTKGQFWYKPTLDSISRSSSKVLSKLFKSMSRDVINKEETKSRNQTQLKDSETESKDHITSKESVQVPKLKEVTNSSMRNIFSQRKPSTDMVTLKRDTEPKSISDFDMHARVPQGKSSEEKSTHKEKPYVSREEFFRLKREELSRRYPKPSTTANEDVDCECTCEEDKLKQLKFMLRRTLTPRKRKQTDGTAKKENEEDKRPRTTSTGGSTQENNECRPVRRLEDVKMDEKYRIDSSNFQSKKHREDGEEKGNEERFTTLRKETDNNILMLRGLYLDKNQSQTCSSRLNTSKEGSCNKKRLFNIKDQQTNEYATSRFKNDNNTHALKTLVEDVEKKRKRDRPSDLSKNVKILTISKIVINESQLNTSKTKEFKSQERYYHKIHLSHEYLSENKEIKLKKGLENGNAHKIHRNKRSFNEKSFLKNDDYRDRDGSKMQASKEFALSRKETNNRTRSSLTKADEELFSVSKQEKFETKFSRKRANAIPSTEDIDDLYKTITNRNYTRRSYEDIEDEITYQGSLEIADLGFVENEGVDFKVTQYNTRDQGLDRMQYNILPRNTASGFFDDDMNKDNRFASKDSITTQSRYNIKLPSSYNIKQSEKYQAGSKLSILVDNVGFWERLAVNREGSYTSLSDEILSELQRPNQNTKELEVKTKKLSGMFAPQENWIPTPLEENGLLPSTSITEGQASSSIQRKNKGMRKAVDAKKRDGNNSSYPERRNNKVHNVGSVIPEEETNCDEDDDNINGHFKGAEKKAKKKHLLKFAEYNTRIFWNPVDIYPSCEAVNSMYTVKSDTIVHKSSGGDLQDNLSVVSSSKSAHAVCAGFALQAARKTGIQDVFKVGTNFLDRVKRFHTPMVEPLVKSNIWGSRKKNIFLKAGNSDESFGSRVRPPIVITSDETRTEMSTKTVESLFSLETFLCDTQCQTEGLCFCRLTTDRNKSKHSREVRCGKKRTRNFGNCYQAKVRPFTCDYHAQRMDDDDKRLGKKVTFDRLNELAKTHKAASKESINSNTSNYTDSSITSIEKVKRIVSAKKRTEPKTAYKMANAPKKVRSGTGTTSNGSPNSKISAWSLKKRKKRPSRVRLRSPHSASTDETTSKDTTSGRSFFQKLFWRKREEIGELKEENLSHHSKNSSRSSKSKQSRKSSDEDSLLEMVKRDTQRHRLFIKPCMPMVQKHDKIVSANEERDEQEISSHSYAEHDKHSTLGEQAGGLTSCQNSCSCKCDPKRRPHSPEQSSSNGELIKRFSRSRTRSERRRYPKRRSYEEIKKKPSCGLIPMSRSHGRTPSKHDETSSGSLSQKSGILKRRFSGHSKSPDISQPPSDEASEKGSDHQLDDDPTKHDLNPVDLKSHEDFEWKNEHCSECCQKKKSKKGCSACKKPKKKPQEPKVIEVKSSREKLTDPVHNLLHPTQHHHEQEEILHKKREHCGECCEKKHNKTKCSTCKGSRSPRGRSHSHNHRHHHSPHAEHSDHEGKDEKKLHLSHLHPSQEDITSHHCPECCEKKKKGKQSCTACKKKPEEHRAHHESHHHLHFLHHETIDHHLARKQEVCEECCEHQNDKKRCIICKKSTKNQSATTIPNKDKLEGDHSRKSSLTSVNKPEEATNRIEEKCMCDKEHSKKSHGEHKATRKNIKCKSCNGKNGCDCVCDNKSTHQKSKETSRFPLEIGRHRKSNSSIPADRDKRKISCTLSPKNARSRQNISAHLALSSESDELFLGSCDLTDSAVVRHIRMPSVVNIFRRTEKIPPSKEEILQTLASMLFKEKGCEKIENRRKKKIKKYLTSVSSTQLEQLILELLTKLPSNIRAALENRNGQNRAELSKELSTLILSKQKSSHTGQIRYNVSHGYLKRYKKIENDTRFHRTLPDLNAIIANRNLSPRETSEEPGDPNFFKPPHFQLSTTSEQTEYCIDFDKVEVFCKKISSESTSWCSYKAASNTSQTLDGKKSKTNGLGINLTNQDTQEVLEIVRLMSKLSPKDLCRFFSKQCLK